MEIKKENVKTPSDVPEVVITTDIGSADNDDFIAIAYLIHLATTRQVVVRGVCAVHHYAEDRCRMLRIILEQVGLGDVPVAVGTKGAWPPRLRPDGKYTEEEVKRFENLNLLFPTSLLGHPATGTWFPNFGKAMRTIYADHPFWTDAFEPLEASKLIDDLARTCTPTRRLQVICLAPLHDLVGLSATTHARISITLQNGGTEHAAFLLGTSRVAKMGYNGGVCPEATAQLFRELKDAGRVATVVTSGLVSHHHVEASVSDFKRWQHMAQPRWGNRLAQAFMMEWSNCLRANALPTSGKALCDPLTILVATSLSIGPITAESHDIRMQSAQVRVKCDPAWERNYLAVRDMMEVEVGSGISPNANMLTSVNGPIVRQTLLRAVDDVIFAPRPHEIVAEMKAARTAYWLQSSTERSDPRPFIAKGGSPRYWCVDEKVAGTKPLWTNYAGPFFSRTRLPAAETATPKQKEKMRNRLHQAERAYKLWAIVLQWEAGRPPPSSSVCDEY